MITTTQMYWVVILDNVTTVTIILTVIFLICASIAALAQKAAPSEQLLCRRNIGHWTYT